MMIDNKDRKRKTRVRKQKERAIGVVESGIELTTATVNNQKRQQN